jgi:ABC-type glycerol-3-phosphate transport system permease component
VKEPVNVLHAAGKLPRRHRQTRWVRIFSSRYRLLAVVVAALLIVLTYIPFVFVLENSFKSDAQIAQHPFAFLLTFHLDNYATAWNGMLRYLVNTVLVAAISILIGIPAAVMGGYAFAQLKFRGKQVVFYAYLGLLMIPWTLTLIPLFLEIKSFGLFGSWGALILPYAAGSQPLLVFLFRVFFEGIPQDIYDSARIDGSNELQILTKMVAPLSIPVLLTGAILMCINIWGDYLWPTVVLPDYHQYTVSAGLQTFLGEFGFSGQGAGPGFAAYILTMGPIMLLVAGTMKYFVNGVTSGAVKM